MHRRCRRRGLDISPSPEPVLVHFQGANLRLERRSRHPKPSRGAVGSRHTAIALDEGGLNARPFVRLELVAEWLRMNLASPGSFRQPTIIDGQHSSVRQNHRALDDVLQFANISWPRVGTKQLQRVVLDAADLLAGALRTTVNKVFDQE